MRFGGDTKAEEITSFNIEGSTAWRNVNNRSKRNEATYLLVDLDVGIGQFECPHCTRN